MASFLDLVNKVVYESGSEMDPLSIATWNSAEAGRRNYPRFKRNVADAWKMIQMNRLEWEFKDVYISTIINPRLHVINGDMTLPPVVGTVFEGMESGFRFTVTKIIPISGSWLTGDAEALLEFTDYENAGRPKIGENFQQIISDTDPPVENVFTYIRRGSYNVTDIMPLLREVLWDTAVVQYGSNSPLPASYIPWENWLFQESDYAGVATSTPVYISQDYKGDMVFYPQSLAPFRLNFVASTAPQILTNPEDVPAIIPEEYHDWIAWEALNDFAFFDKNPDLQAYAMKWIKFYRKRAERELMPLPSWGANRYSRVPLRADLP